MVLRLSSSRIVVCIVALVAALACSGRQRDSVLLISVDTLRADRLADDGPLPHLRALAARGTTFTQAHSPAPLTLPSHSTLLSGLDTRQHGVRDNVGYAFPAGLPTLATRFAEAGYATAAFIGGYPLSSTFGLDRGFDVYDDTLTRSADPRRSGPSERRAEEVVQALRSWLDERPRAPFFAWLHLFDPHDPYEAPEAFRGRHPQAYDDEVAYVDHALSLLLQGVHGGAFGRTWIVVTSDHGEALGEHGETTHGVFLYEETLHVPLVIVPPFEAATPQIDLPVSLADVAPTILDAVGLPALPDSYGRSLLGVVSGRGPLPEARPLCIESIHGRRRYGWSVLEGFLDWPTKYISAPEPELYDLSLDIAESDNRFREERNAGLERRFVELCPEPVAHTNADGIPAADLERLASLGYVGTSGARSDSATLGDRSRPDPKERIAALPQIERGLNALADGRLDEAREAMETALDLDPDNLVVLNNLGIVALRSNDPARAEHWFREGLRRDSRAERLANNLGLTLSRLGRHAEAVGFFRQALAVRPSFTAARFNLALALYRGGDHDRALEHLRRVTAEDPAFPDLQSTVRVIEKAQHSEARP